MAKSNQFYKGEAVKIIAPKGNSPALEGEYKSDGTIGESASEQLFAGMRAYPTDLNLDNGDINNIFPFHVSDTEGDTYGKLFTIDGSRSLDMVEGQYTVELIYGRGDDGRVIVKYRNAFSIVGSAYKREDEENQGE